MYSDVVLLYLSGKNSALNPSGMTQVYTHTRLCDWKENIMVVRVSSSQAGDPGDTSFPLNNQSEPNHTDQLTLEKVDDDQGWIRVEKRRQGACHAPLPKNTLKQSHDMSQRHIYARKISHVYTLSLK